jgi:hypothetical protein
LDGAFLVGHERIVAYPDITAFFLNYFRVAGDPSGTPKAALTWFSIRAGGVPLQAI